MFVRAYSNFKQYNYNTAVDKPAQSAGNGFIYTYAPTVSALLTGSLRQDLRRYNLCRLVCE
jgi:hypothetical protein